eukprot:SAG11_NODE_852_length_6874_cov_2.914391_3_plen_225_part_00
MASSSGLISRSPERKSRKLAQWSTPSVIAHVERSFIELSYHTVCGAAASRTGPAAAGGVGGAAAGGADLALPLEEHAQGLDRVAGGGLAVAEVEVPVAGSVDRAGGGGGAARVGAVDDTLDHPFHLELVASVHAGVDIEQELPEAAARRAMRRRGARRDKQRGLVRWAGRSSGYGRGPAVGSLLQWDRRRAGGVGRTTRYRRTSHRPWRSQSTPAALSPARTRS